MGGKKGITEKNRGIHYFFRTSSFMLPYIAYFIPGLIVYSGQGFLSPLIESIFINKLTAAMLDKSMDGVLFAALLLAGMYIVFMAVVGVGVIAYVVGTLKATMLMKKKLFRCFVKTGMESAMNTHSGEGISAINTDAEQASNLYGNAISQLLSCVISIVGSAVVVFAVDYRLGLMAFAIGLLSFFIQYKFASPLGKIGAETLNATAGSVKSMSNIFSGAIAIRTFNMQERALISFDEENQKLKVLSFKKAFISMWQDFFTTIQGWLTISGVFAFGGYLVASGRLEFPALMMVPAMCMSLSQGMSRIGSAWAGMQTPVAASKRVFNIIDRDKVIEDGKHTDGKVENNWDLHYNLRVNNMNFTYISSDSAALNNVSIDIKENEMVAFVGESGSGKSTLLRAIIGMYERDDFDICIGNSTFRKSDLLSWRRKFAYVDQSCKLFDMTIGENIALGREGADIGAIKDAAANAFADSFISALPNGYDTMCGEKGASLSGGQKQRIAIARALVRKAPVLVFDEATSALDSESEKQVMETIYNLRKNHTILITTHNINNIVTADTIIVMDNGRIAETGTHEGLMARNGLYKRLFEQNAKE